MRFVARVSICVLIATLLLMSVPMLAQDASATDAANAAAARVPRMIKFSGTIAGAKGATGLTFALYKDQTGGAPLWLETQNVNLDDNGRYTVYLGSNHTHGLPAELFARGDARWLGVQPDGQAELTRTMLVSVPYALAAGDAQTLGGKPLSSFVFAGSKNGVAEDGLNYVNTAAMTQAINAISGAAVGYLPVFTSTAGDMTSSGLFQNTNGTIGINTTNPASMFHIVSPLPGVATFQRQGGSRFTFQNDTDAGGTGVIFYVTDSTAANYKALSFDASSLRFRAAGSDTNVLYMSSIGNLGLGTTVPAFPLTVDKVNGFTTARFGTISPVYMLNGPGGLGFNLFSDGSLKYGTAGTGSILAQSGNSLLFYTAPSGSANGAASITARMALTVDGKLGIGNIAPAEVLDVAGNVKASGVVSGGSVVSAGNVTAAGTVSATAVSAATGGFAQAANAGTSVYGNATGTDGTGVWGQADTGTNAWGVAGISSQGIGVFGVSSTGYAGYFSGNVEVTGKVTAGAGNTGTPLAYGSFNYDGTTSVASPNITCTWVAASTHYECNVANEVLYYYTYIYSVTPNVSPLVPVINSSHPTLWITFYNLSGAAVQSQGFSLTIFKP